VRNLTAQYLAVERARQGEIGAECEVASHFRRTIEALNAEATGNLARAGERDRVRRFIFLSSVRAQADVSARHVLTEDLPPAPTDAYGRSKLLAEQQLAQFDLDWVALRLPLVFGTGVKGNMATLLKLARSPLPLPFGALRAQRSLLSLENLLSALLLLIRSQEPLRRPLIVADPAPLSVPEMIGAMRSAVGRRAAIFPVPAALLRTAFRLGGRAELYRRIAEPLIADPTQLLQMGWVPGMKTQDALAALARAGP
jgi:nucleoside-diphosphate-sugar epimerase